MEAAKGNRWGLRDATMVLVAYRHGLRSSELVDLRWDQVDFETATLHVRRVKKGTPSTHPILGDELRALRRLQREQAPKSPFVFTSERGAPFTTAGFARMVERAGSEAKLGLRPTPTCSGTLAATRSPTGGTTRGRCKPTLGIGISSTRCATPKCRRHGLRISGGVSGPLIRQQDLLRKKMSKITCRSLIEARQAGITHLGPPKRLRLVYICDLFFALLLN